MLASLLASYCALLPSVGAPPHDPERQVVEVTERIRLRPADPVLYLERGRLQTALGEHRAALADFATVLRLEPRSIDALVATALAERRLGNPVAASLALRKAAALGARGADVDRLQARVLLDLGRPAEAADLFARALASTARPVPEDFLELAAAQVAGQAGEGEGARVALAALERGLRVLGPVVGLVDAAVLLDVQQGEFDRALDRLEGLRPRMARLAPLHERRARVLEAAGRLEAAASERLLAGSAGLDEAVVGPLPASGSRPVKAPTVAPAPVPVATSLVPTGATWRYRATATAPANGWSAPGYDDSSWASGPAQLGYGDGDEATVIASGPANAHYPTAWFRHQFTVADPTVFPTARVRLLCDDGAVVYVNGVEIARWNLANGAVGAGTWASVAIAGADESAFRVFAFPPGLLVAGTNVVAVEVHQVGATSSDMSFALELLGGSGPISILRGPYLQDGTPTSAVVRWRTDQPTATQLWVGPSASALQPAYFDATPTTEHAATVSGLPPETLHHYGVGDASGMLPGQPGTQTFRTLPPIGAVRPLRAWVLGDAGFGSPSQLAVRNQYAAFAATHPADAILMLGDNAYYVGTDAEYQVGLFDVYGSHLASTFCWATLGNHDAYSVSTASQSGPYYDNFTLPAAGEAGGLPSGTEAYYSFDRGHVHFVCLDSMDSDRTANGAMMTWLAADLASTSARWIVAFFHHPPYSAGSHVSDNPLDSGGRMGDMRAIALPILEAGGVDLVLCGHSHSYERSFLLDGHYGPSATLQPAMLLDKGDGRESGDGAYGKPTAGRAPHEGAVHVVAGSAGATGGGPLDHPAMHVGLNRLGSLVLDFEGDRLDATFVGAAGVEDQFTLVKGDGRTLFRDQPHVSVGAGGRQDFRLVAGPQHANRLYILAGAWGTTPGIPLWGVQVPLNPDTWLQLSIELANSPVYPNSVGLLDGNGSATAALVLPPLLDPALVGTALHHAYVVGDIGALTMASNTVKLTFVP